MEASKQPLIEAQRPPADLSKPKDQFVECVVNCREFASAKVEKGASHIT